jgi:hypothetical protein
MTFPYDDSENRPFLTGAGGCRGGVEDFASVSTYGFGAPVKKDKLRYGTSVGILTAWRCREIASTATGTPGSIARNSKLPPFGVGIGPPGAKTPRFQAVGTQQVARSFHSGWYSDRRDLQGPADVLALLTLGPVGATSGLPMLNLSAELASDPAFFSQVYSTRLERSASHNSPSWVCSQSICSFYNRWKSATHPEHCCKILRYWQRSSSSFTSSVRRAGWRAHFIHQKAGHRRQGLCFRLRVRFCTAQSGDIHQGWLRYSML